MKKYFALMLAIAVLLSGCPQEGMPEAEDVTNELVEDGSDNMADQSNEPKLGTNIVIETEKGDIKIALYEEDAPKTTTNFLALVEQGFYNGLTFHRVEEGFVVQGGDPTGTGAGGSGRTIPLEISPKLKHVKGALGMARSNDPNSASSQFYIALDNVHQLDGSYAVFGIVTEGMNVAEQLEVGDRMLNVRVE